MSLVTFYIVTIWIGMVFTGSAFTICPQGFFLKDSAQCVQCLSRSQCTGGQVVVQECTSSKNLECGCPKGHFFNALKQHCFPCKIAESGSIYMRNCSRFRNSKVAQCAEKTYTADGFTCRNCSTCVNGILKNCTVRIDTVCKPSNKDEKEIVSSKTKEVAAGVVCGIVFLAIIAILGIIYVRRRHGNRNLHHDDAAGSHMQSVDSIAGRLPKEVNGNVDSLHRPDPPRHGQRRAEYQRANSNMSSNGQVNPLTDSMNPSTVATSSIATTVWNGAVNPLAEARAESSIVGTMQWKNTSLEYLTYESRQRLSMLLYPDARNNWKRLADYLGYSDIEIRNFAMAKERCVEDLLRSYESSKEGATIPALHQALINIERHDAAKVLVIYQE